MNTYRAISSRWKLPSTLAGLLSGLLASLLIFASPLHAAPAEQTLIIPNEVEWTGIVESMPGAGFVGPWIVGGLNFVADGNTQVDETNGNLTPGACADISYEVGSGQNLALSIEFENDPTCASDAADEEMDEGDEDESGEDEGDEDESDEDENETYGTVTSMPSGSLIGIWMIDGVSYTSTSATEFEEEYGPLATGVSVELEFEIVNGVNQLLEIESHPEAGEGPTDRTGVIQSTDQAVSAASIMAAGRWQIGEVTYTVAPTTRLDESSGVLTVGATAAVNSFTAADGREIATQISTVRGATQLSDLYLPLFAGF